MTPLGDVRSLRLLAWYPVVPDGDGPLDIDFVAGLYVREGVYVKGEPPEDKTFPVMVFSHGNQGIAEQSYFLTEHFASHGWIVLAPDHTGNTLFPPHEPIGSFSYIRPQDMSAVLDYLDDIPTDHPIHGHVDTPRVVAGHSYGAYTALALGGAVYDATQLDGCIEGADLLEICGSGAERYFDTGFLDERFNAAIAMTPPRLTRF